VAGEGQAFNSLLERAQRLIDDAHVGADMHAVSLSGRIIAGKIDGDGLALVGNGEGSDAPGQRLPSLRRGHGFRRNPLSRRHGHFSMNDITTNFVMTSAWNFT
jgi:hypothetical protein